MVAQASRLSFEKEPNTYMTDPTNDQKSGATDPLNPQEGHSGTSVNSDPSQNTFPDLPVSKEFTFLGPPEGPDEIGRLAGYRILRTIGRGGMGVVFEAQDPVLMRHVAIKVPLAAASDETFRQRFLREARLAATLSNEHIATIYQAGQQGDVPFMVMELLRGESLDTRLNREKTLPLSEALRIAREVAEGLRVAHGKGLVHRDIKPGNIWLEQREAYQGPAHVKILDFGVAREFRPQAGITIVGQIVGSLGYMAPEQVVGGDLDGRTDLFALGCVLYEMLAGRVPLSGTDTRDSLRAVVLQNPVPIAQRAPHLPASVCQLVDKLLAKEPKDRPASAEAVVERIRQIEHDLSRQTAALPGSAAPTLPAKQEKRASWNILFGVAAVMIALVVGVFMLIKTLNRTPDPKDSSEPEVVDNQNPEIKQPFRIGILYSQSGSMQSTETPVMEATLMAVDEINQAGGVLGRQIEYISADGRSTEEGFAAGAENLIKENKVVAIFGCWMSSSRKRVEAVCRNLDNLLIYAINYEGLEESPYVVYVGGGPNQQLIPAVGWAVGQKKKKRFFLVGSDYVYSRAANAILRDQLKEFNVECVGEDYVPLQVASSPKFADIAAQIKKSEADAVLSTVDGAQSNFVFFHALAEARLTSKDCPVISFSFYETELRSLNERDADGHFAVANYFESIRTPENQDFIKRFRKRHPTRVVNDPMVAAYSSVYLWKQAVDEKRDPSPALIRDAMVHQKFAGPEGMLAIDPADRHALRTARIGRAVGNREFKIEFVSPEPMPAVPFPPTRTRKQWEGFLEDLYKGWGNRWEGPAR
jgi:urea transport system substrate-binding protein